MKKLIVLLPILLTLSMAAKGQTISPGNFFQLFMLAQNENGVDEINLKLSEISENWEFKGGEPKGSIFELDWIYNAHPDLPPLAFFVLASAKPQNKPLMHKVTYAFFDRDLLLKYVDLVSHKEGIKLTHTDAKTDGSKTSVYEDPQTNMAWIFTISPWNKTLNGKLVPTLYKVSATFRL